VMVLTVGLFDGIGALRVSADALSLPMSGHVSCEVCKEGNRVVESHFPETTLVGNVEEIDDAQVAGWAAQHSNVGVVVCGGGPPCQGVSGLNANGKGRSKMQEVPCFPMLAVSTICAKGIFPGLKYISLWKVSGRWMRRTALS